MSAKITRAVVEKKLTVDQVTFSRGIFTVREGFFYTHGRTAQNLVDQVKAAFPEATILDSGEVWKAFRGGASVTAQSHWFVKFSFTVSLDDYLAPKGQPC